MNSDKLIEAVNRLRPFEMGDDPYRHGQNDTIERVLDLIRQNYPETGIEPAESQDVDTNADKVADTAHCEHELAGWYASKPDELRYFNFCPKCGKELSVGEVLRHAKRKKL